MRATISSTVTVGSSVVASKTILDIFGISAPGWFIKTEYRSAFLLICTALFLPERFAAGGLNGAAVTFKPWVQTISTSLVYRFNWGGPARPELLMFLLERTAQGPGIVRGAFLRPAKGVKGSRRVRWERFILIDGAHEEFGGGQHRCRGPGSSGDLKPRNSKWI